MFYGMTAILVEVMLFIAAIVAVANLLFAAVKRYTPLGLILRQRENRKRIEQEAENICPVHGRHEEHELVRLASGDRICPECFGEVVRDSIR